jgi:hypothetical protein
MIRLAISAGYVAALLGLASCARVPTGPLPPGEWGGQHIGLTVLDRGATVEYDCASGTIDEPLHIDSRGGFLAVGTHTRGHGGPARIDEVPDRHPARYAGYTDGRTMTLTVTLSDSGELLGTFKLVRGTSPAVFKCL